METSCHYLEEKRELGVHYEQSTKSGYITQTSGKFWAPWILRNADLYHLMVFQHYQKANLQHFDMQNVIVHY